LPTGYPERRHPEPIAQAIGYNFTLLELVPKEGITLKPEEEAYVGEGPRDKVKTVKGILPHVRLTTFAKSLLPAVVEHLVKEEEKRFVHFFNTAGPVTLRMHKFELIPGIGKKHVQDLVDARRKKPFESFADLATRVHPFPDVVKTIAQRILVELEGNEKYYIFTPPKFVPTQYGY
jgi:putative nucleotide binding protein